MQPRAGSAYLPDPTAKLPVFQSAEKLGARKVRERWLTRPRSNASTTAPQASPIRAEVETVQLFRSAGILPAGEACFAKVPAGSRRS
jgi:hypothetical protein